MTEDAINAINLVEKLGVISKHWDPHVVADYNDSEVMVVKFQGEFPFHKHDRTDDFFLVLTGEMIMDYEDRTSEVVRAGEMVIVPKRVVHRPRAEREVQVLLIEAKGEPNTCDSDREPASKPRI